MDDHQREAQVPSPEEVERRARIERKLEAAMKLPNRIKHSWWSKTPMISPRAAALLGDPETAEILMRATRNLGRDRGA